MTTLINVPGGKVEIILRGSDVPEARRDFLLERINAIISTNWQSTRPTWWSRKHSPFRDDFALAFFHADDEIVAYFIHQQLHLDGIPVFYGAGTAVLSEHHGKRHYPLLQAHAMTAAWRALAPRPPQVYVAWRTRNPAIWISNSRYCKAVTPSLWTGEEDPKLQDACVRLANVLYPGCPIEVPSMLMHNVFDDFVEMRKPKLHPGTSMRSRLVALLANPTDAIFSLGVVDGAAFEALERTIEGRANQAEQPEAD